MIPPSAPPPNKPHFRTADLVVVGGVALVLSVAAYNIVTNMSASGIGLGFGLLSQTVGFDVSEALIPYGLNDSYGRVITTGVVNTLFLSLVCLVLSTAAGVAVGLVSVGPSPIGPSLALAYVEFFRNIPKLLVLVERDEVPEIAWPMLAEVAGGRSLRVVHMPIRDYEAPNGDFLGRWSDMEPQIAAMLDAGGTVALSCHYGAGRSGTVAAAMLMDRGLSTQAAIEHVRSKFADSIESQRQIEWLQKRGSPASGPDQAS